MGNAKSTKSTTNYMKIGVVAFLVLLSAVLAVLYYKGYFSKNKTSVQKKAMVESKSSKMKSYVKRPILDFIKNNKGKSVVMFGASFCGHCTKMKPAFAKASDKLKDVECVYVQSTNKEQRDALKKYKIEGFPSVLFFQNGKKIGEYSGSRSTTDIVKKAKKAFSKN